MNFHKHFIIMMLGKVMYSNVQVDIEVRLRKSFADNMI